MHLFKKRVSPLKMAFDCLLHIFLLLAVNFLTPKTLRVVKLSLKMILSDYKSLYIENVSLLAMTLCQSRVIKDQDTEEALLIVISFHYFDE